MQHADHPSQPSLPIAAVSGYRNPTMLTARGERAVGAGELRWALAFASGLWSMTVDRRGLFLDTRFVPAAAGAAKPKACLLIMLNGTWQEVGTGSRRFEGPCAFVISKEQLEGADGKRSCTFRSSGDPYRAVEIHLPVEDLVDGVNTPHPVDLDARAWEAAQNVAQVAQRQSEGGSALLVELIDRLAELGIVSESAASRARRPLPAPFVRVSSAILPMIERFILSPTLNHLSSGSGMSLRQVDRDFGAFFSNLGFSGSGWRPLGRHIRYKLAVLLLSADGVSVGDVSRAVGYGSSDAMARAFRDAGMPPPNEVQRRLREPI
jgi:AraC-like DNA-binding protein